MKKENELLETIERTFKNIFLEKGIYYVDAEYVKEPKGNVLRIFIDKEGGVDLDSCEMASNIVSDWLDEVDPIEESYFLEVSSPGAEREIKNDEQLETFIGKKILIKCYKKINNEKEFIGKLKSFDKEKVTLIMGKLNVDFFRKDIAIIKSQIEI
ncbi:ribosome maturation factor RimP [Parvimonas sp. D2]|uniref:ribosome maturation factor RimP n=1 Tax=unclassified Parvimonas TaxID=1151464 RepID=UPI002B466FC1|nr:MULTISPECIES: ribosome maturation factor RimP [unclassified Parvimonas]MEB3012694.1 ribosome maturation factor RimP [Parvimonas sp. D2]MEB3086873.1 ribosome maturation factor RimP [Parvimonas sp. D4]